jgi:hypothetical protein
MLFGITTENLKINSAPFRVESIAMMALLGGEDSLGHDAADAVRDEMKYDLVVLNASMKEPKPNWDCSVIINPLLAGQGPALALIPKLKRQLENMKKNRDDFLRREEEKRGADFLRKDQERPSAAPAGTSRRRNRTALPADSCAEPFGGLHDQKKRGRPPRLSSTVLSEVLPAWGPLKRCSERMEAIAYHETVKLARWLFDRWTMKAVLPAAGCDLSSTPTLHHRCRGTKFRASSTVF